MVYYKTHYLFSMCGNSISLTKSIKNSNFPWLEHEYFHLKNKLINEQGLDFTKTN